ncbi:MAG: hypothetical protein IPH05_13040 [Flavobacteriales bacterium]|jgi:hypothetical protein|nr:hypothetical protein [Flavobacteriales bacterium]MBK6549575.1 hypothetical protein [Flavobacteriales bacterium]MBK6883837.1 hypothetical protein [Flavobacteriales bacterium]MBK7100229.1 hypothetical protein [Flavobacteriales bacterium]MBK7110922.1 hypothetical protein [Flavobacteriales bacterium]
MSEPTKQEQQGKERVEASVPSERTYGTTSSEQELGFDPLKDLNLPSSYQEMLERLGKLGGDRTPETLN